MTTVPWKYALKVYNQQNPATRWIVPVEGTKIYKEVRDIMAGKAPRTLTPEDFLDNKKEEPKPEPEVEPEPDVKPQRNLIEELLEKNRKLYEEEQKKPKEYFPVVKPKPFVVRDRPADIRYSPQFNVKL